MGSNMLNADSEMIKTTCFLERMRSNLSEKLTESEDMLLYNGEKPEKITFECILSYIQSKKNYSQCKTVKHHNLPCKRQYKCPIQFVFQYIDDILLDYLSKNWNTLLISSIDSITNLNLPY